MAFDPKSMNIDYRTIMSIPIGVRQSMRSSGILESLSLSLTPGQRASLFPSYYKQGLDVMAGQRSMAGGEPESKFKTDASWGKQRALSPSDEKTLREKGIDTSGAKKNQASLGDRKAIYTKEGLANFEDPRQSGKIRPEVLERFKDRNLPASLRNNNMGAMSIGDKGNPYVEGMPGFAGKTPRPANEGGYYARYATPEHGVAAASRNLENYGKKGINTVDGIIGKWATGGQDSYKSTVVKYLNNAGYKVDSKTPLDLSDANVRLAILKAQSAHESGAGVPVYTDDVFAKGVNYQLPEMKTSTATATPAQRVPQDSSSTSGMAYVKTMTEVDGLPVPEGTGAAAEDHYGSMRQNANAKISKDDPIWDSLDPSLKENKHMLIDADTGLVGRDALLSADAAAKVLRKNGYIPRPVSGGDNHSANHGAGRDANYAIDMAASIQDESGKIKPVKLGSEVPYEVKRDMAIASYLASDKSGTSSRIGFPLGDSNASMHIQQDPQMHEATWGYDQRTASGARMSRDILETTPEGRRYLSDIETIKGLDQKDKSAVFASVTGMTGPTQMAQSTVNAEEIKVDTSAATVDQSQVQTASLMPKKPTMTLPSFYTSDAMGATTAFAGGGEIDQPHMAVPLTKKGDQSNKLIAETGPEKVTPRHKINANEVGQQNYQMPAQPQMQEKPREAIKSEAPTQPIVTTGAVPRPMAVVAVDHPLMPPTARKAYADAKLETRYNNLSPTGAVYTNHNL